MQKLDQLLGKPILAVLRAFTRSSRCLAGAQNLALPPKRVIVTKFIGLGSVTVALPMLEALKRNGVEIAFWTFQGQAGLVRLTGLADHVWAVRSSPWKLPFDFIRTIWRSRSFRPDAFIDLEPTANCSAILARLSGAPERLGFLCGKASREEMFTRLVSLSGQKHMSQACLGMLTYLGLGDRREGEEKPRLPELPLQVLRAARAIPSLPGKRRITLNVNTSDLARTLRMWPAERWVALANELIQDPEVELIFPGVQSEWRTNQEIIDRLADPSRATNLAGKTDFVTLLATLRASDLVFSVDSGIMHLAAWVGAPLIALFGPETPALFGPVSRNSVVLWAQLPCSPCCTIATEKHTRCRDNRCMQEITVSQALAAARQLQERLKASPLRIAA